MSFRFCLGLSLVLGFNLDAGTHKKMVRQGDTGKDKFKGITGHYQDYIENKKQILNLPYQNF